MMLPFVVAGSHVVVGVGKGVTVVAMVVVDVVLVVVVDVVVSLPTCIIMIVWESSHKRR